MDKECVVVKVGQLRRDGIALKEIGAWVFQRSVWEQLCRVFTQTVDSETPGGVWLDLCDMNGDLINDEPLIIPAHHGRWMLRSWLKPPAPEWRKITIPKEA